MNDEDMKELEFRLSHYSPLTLDVISQVAGPLTISWESGVCKAVGKGGRIAAYRATVEEAVAALALEVLRDERVLTRWNRNGSD